MHMADALVSPAVAVTMYAASAAAAGVSLVQLHKEEAAAPELAKKKLPTMAVMSALVFAGQMINYTIPGTGSSGHLCGGMLLSAILGPWAGFLSMIVILAIQALFFADGGLLALGANVWNMAFYGCFVGYFLIYRPLMQGRLLAGKGRTKLVLASVLGCVVTLQLGALSVVVETSLSGITALPFGAFAALMQPIHLAIGLVEGGITAAVLLFVYSTQGYYMTTAYGRDSKNARKDIPFVLLLCVPTLCILYVGVAMAGVGVMSVEEYGNSTTLVFAAQRIFPTWLFYFFIIGGPIMALLSTLNSSFAYNSITIGQSCDDGWLPKSFGKKNKSGARPYILTFMYVVGIIPIVFGLSITTITNMVQLITSAFAILNFTAEIKMPKKYPDAWKQSRYHVPDGLYYTICCVSLALFLVVLWKSLLSMNIGLAVINVVVIVIAGLIGFWRSKTGNIEIHTSVWAEDYQ